MAHRSNPPRKHQSKKARRSTKYRARAWWRASDNIVWTGPWRDTRREAVQDAQADYSHVSSRNYEIETSDGHVADLSDKQIDQAAAAEYAHLRDRSVWGNPRDTEVDEHAANELELYIDNDEPLYRQWQAIVKNMWKHRSKGRYDSERAADGFMHLVDKAAKQYAKEFSVGTDWNQIFTVPTRRAVAREYAKSFEQNNRDESYYMPSSAKQNPSKAKFRTFANPEGTEVLWLQSAELYVLAGGDGALLEREVLGVAKTPDELDQILREFNPTRVQNPRRNMDRRKNGAGLGALIGSTIGSVLGLGVASVPIAALGSLAGGAIGGYVGAPKDRKKRGAAGGAVGGALLGPIGAGVGGYIGGRKSDADYRRRNPEQNPSLRRLEQYSKRELADMPTLSEGHTDDLKVEDEVAGVPTRWWLSRMTVDDGETHAVHVEQLVDGRWEVVHDYDHPDTYEERFGNPGCGCEHGRASSISRRIANP